MKILVTGAAGFIGFSTAWKLVERGDEVVGLDNLNEYYDPTLKRARLARLEGKPNWRFVKLDLADGSGMRQLFTAPFGPKTLDRYDHRPLEAETSLPESDLDWLRWTVGATSVASLIAGGTFSALAYKEKSSLSDFTSAQETQEINERINTYNQAAVGLYIVSGVALTSFLIWTFWPEEKEVIPFFSPQGEPGMLMLLRW